jgi:hypothetical protein
MKLLVSCLLAAFVFFSCKKQDTSNSNGNNNNNPNPTVQKGTVAGKVVTPNNKTVVKNAIVFVAEGATIYSTFTDVNGNFSLEAPIGQKILNIQSGTGKIFRTTMNVTIEAQKTTAVTSPITLTQVASLAYVPGSFDKIQTILMDSLGYTATLIQPGDLHVASTVTQYNAIFINCSGSISVDYVQDSVLANYVANGGSLYVSDYAVAMLIGAWNGATCPGMRAWGFIPDTKLCTERIGTTGFVNNAPIVYPALQTYLNKATMNIKYDLSQWETVQNYDTAFWQVMVKHPANMKPLLMRTANFTNSSAGTIPIGSTNNNMVTICHKPPGTTPVTITIPSATLSVHLAHGDSMGSCNSTNGAGRIYFTTFHNEPNGLISPDMKQILDYIILNL